MANDLSKVDLTTMEPQSITELMQLASMVASSGMVPDSYRNKPSDVLVCFLMGRELGLKYMQSLEGICVINGRPTIWGKVARGLVMASGLVEDIHETDPEEVERTGKARCVIKRKGVAKEFTGTFSMTAANRAGLGSKDNYKKYPADMLIWRAFHRAALKACPEVYHGLEAAEEAIDVTPPKEPARDNYPTGEDSSSGVDGVEEEKPQGLGSMGLPNAAAGEGVPTLPGGGLAGPLRPVETTGGTITVKQQKQLFRDAEAKGYTSQTLEMAVRDECGCEIEGLPCDEEKLHDVYARLGLT